MAEEKKEKQEQQEDEVIKTIVAEYDKKIADLEEQHKKEIDQVRKEEHEKSVQTIKAIMSGRKVETTENPAPEKEVSYEEQLIIDTRKKLGMKGEK